MGQNHEMWSLIYGKAHAKHLGSYLAAFASPLEDTVQHQTVMDAMALSGQDPEAGAIASASQLMAIMGNERAFPGNILC